MNHKATRGKLVAYKDIHLAVHEDGQVQVRVGQHNAMLLTEQQASDLSDLLGDVLEWAPGGSQTIAQEDKALEHDEHE